MSYVDRVVFIHNGHRLDRPPPSRHNARMPHDVDAAWDRIEAWLRTNAPASDDHLGIPALKATIPPVAELVGEPLPDDLVAWWRRSCGTTSFHAGGLLTGFAPYTINEAMECREMMLRIAACDDSELAALAAEPAGSPCWNWLPMWIPIAHDTGGEFLFVDLPPARNAAASIGGTKPISPPATRYGPTSPPCSPTSPTHWNTAAR